MVELVIRIVRKLLQYTGSMLGGLLMAVETSIDFFVPCLLAVLLDVISAYFLGRRVHKKYPERSDGKFKSEYKHRFVFTMLIVWLCIILANYVDIAVRQSADGLAVRATVGGFLIYEIWSCLENWSSENDKPIAKALQRIMVNKAERHFDVPLRDILLKEDGRPTESAYTDNSGKRENEGIITKDEGR